MAYGARFFFLELCDNVGFSHKVNSKLLFLPFGSLADGDIVTLICISWMTNKTTFLYEYWLFLFFYFISCLLVFLAPFFSLGKYLSF